MKQSYGEYRIQAPVKQTKTEVILDEPSYIFFKKQKRIVYIHIVVVQYKLNITLFKQIEYTTFARTKKP